MLDDIRNHDMHPTDIEKEWMAFDAVEVVVKSIVLAVVALTIGISASLLMEPPGGSAAVAVASRH